MYGDISIFGYGCTPNTNHNPKLNPLPLPPGQRDITCHLKKVRIFIEENILHERYKISQTSKLLSNLNKRLFSAENVNLCRRHFKK